MRLKPTIVTVETLVAKHGGKVVHPLEGKYYSNIVKRILAAWRVLRGKGFVVCYERDK